MNQHMACIRLLPTRHENKHHSHSTAIHQLGELHKCRQWENLRRLQNPEQPWWSYSWDWWKMEVSCSCRSWQPMAGYLWRNPAVCTLSRQSKLACSLEQECQVAQSSLYRLILSLRQLPASCYCHSHPRNSGMEPVGVVPRTSGCVL